MPGRIMISAGEASGDMYGGRLVQSLRELDPDLDFFGLGGNAMSTAGVRLITHIRELSVMGFLEVFRELGRIRRIQKQAIIELERIRPDILILIDFYKFNIGLARRAKKLGIPVVYYVPPKLWVWGKKHRMKVLKNYVDRVLAIFPFEEDFYRSEKMPVTFVGNPLIELLEEGGLEDFKADHGLISEEDTIIGLLPGSRAAEIQRMLPVFLEAAELISCELDGTTRFFMPLAHTISTEMVESILANSPVVVVTVDGDAGKVLKLADVSMVASGTATLEAFMLGALQVVAYKTSRLTYELGTRIINLSRVSLPNILAGRDVVEELIQDEVLPERLARNVLELLGDAERRADYLESSAAVRKQLMGDGVSATAAREVMRVMGESQ
jgi:lipid-A-disaccharide synthase